MNKNLTKFSSLLIILIFSFYVGNVQLKSQPNWHPLLDQDQSHILKVEKYFGDEFKYVGTRLINNIPMLLLFDLKEEIHNRRENNYEAQFWQVEMKADDNPSGAIFKVLCDCSDYKMKMIYLQDIHNVSGMILNEEKWSQGVGDGLAARILNIVCPDLYIANNKVDVINLKKEYGVYKIPVIINNIINSEFILDTGAGDVLISKSLGDLLKIKGIINEDTYIKVNNYIMADGSTSQYEVHSLKSIQVGGKIVNNVICAISDDINSQNLLGQSLLKRIGEYKIDNKKEVLILNK